MCELQQALMNGNGDDICEIKGNDIDVPHIFDRLTGVNKRGYSRTSVPEYDIHHFNPIIHKTVEKAILHENINDFLLKLKKDESMLQPIKTKNNRPKFPTIVRNHKRFRKINSLNWSGFIMGTVKKHRRMNRIYRIYI